jgi:cell division protein FtsQ
LRKRENQGPDEHVLGDHALGDAIAPSDHVPDAVLRELSDAFGDGVPGSDVAVAAAGGGADRQRIVIAADDLPDAVYLDDDESGSGRIVIEDDSIAHDAGRLSTGTSAGVDPRMRARRIAVRRAESRKRLRWAAVVAVIVVVVVGSLAVLGSGLFAIDTVDVEGAVYTDQTVLDEIVADLLGEPILTADLTAAEERLVALPWVRAARVTMDFPDRVLIEVAERRALAFYRGSDSRYRVIDIEGQVLDVIDGKPVDYVEITGIGPDLEPGADSGGTYRGAAQLANALPPTLRPRVQSLGVTEAGEITMLLTGDPTGAVDESDPVPSIVVVFGQPDDYQEKLVALVNELERHETGSITSIDVSTGSPIVA